MLHDLGFEKAHLSALRIFHETHLQTEPDGRFPDGWAPLGTHVASRMNKDDGTVQLDPGTAEFNPDGIYC